LALMLPHKGSCGNGVNSDLASLPEIFLDAPGRAAVAAARSSFILGRLRSRYSLH
jgi:hypothetical protein